MTIVEMGTYFDILQDKFGSPYFTNSEKSLLINRAQVQFVKELFPVNIGKVNVELSKDTLSEVEPLIYTLPTFNLASTGIITDAYIQTQLAILVPLGILWRPLSFGWTYNGITRPIKYVRPNDWYAFQENSFKNPTVENPKLTESSTGYKVLPATTAGRIDITLLKYPASVDIDSAVSSDLPNHTHDKIVTLALELAGVGTRDEMLAQLLALRGGNAQTTSHLG